LLLLLFKLLFFKLLQKRVQNAFLVTLDVFIEIIAVPPETVPG